jgi:predicted SprT family Zn-dependent metalloprotease
MSSSETTIKLSISYDSDIEDNTPISKLFGHLKSKKKSKTVKNDKDTKALDLRNKRVLQAKAKAQKDAQARAKAMSKLLIKAQAASERVAKAHYKAQAKAKAKAEEKEAKAEAKAKAKAAKVEAKAQEKAAKAKAKAEEKAAKAEAKVEVKADTICWDQANKWEVIQNWWVELKTQHAELLNWVLVKNDRCVRRAGCANFSKLIIEISSLYINETTEENAKDTLLHEVAHALAGHKAGHGNEWKKIALQIGCTAQRCHTVNFGTEKAKAIGSCNCIEKDKFTFFKMTKKIKNHLQGVNKLRCRECKSTLDIRSNN